MRRSAIVCCTLVLVQGGALSPACSAADYYEKCGEEALLLNGCVKCFHKHKHHFTAIGCGDVCWGMLNTRSLSDSCAASFLRRCMKRCDTTETCGACALSNTISLATAGCTRAALTKTCFSIDYLRMKDPSRRPIQETFKLSPLYVEKDVAEKTARPIYHHGFRPPVALPCLTTDETNRVIESIQKLRKHWVRRNMGSEATGLAMVEKVEVSRGFCFLVFDSCMCSNFRPGLQKACTSTVSARP